MENLRHPIYSYAVSIIYVAGFGISMLGILSSNFIVVISGWIVIAVGMYGTYNIVKEKE